MRSVIVGGFRAAQAHDPLDQVERLIAGAGRHGATGLLRPPRGANFDKRRTHHRLVPLAAVTRERLELEWKIRRNIDKKVWLKHDRVDCRLRVHEPSRLWNA